MTTANGLNFLFLKRFSHLLHIFLPVSRLSSNVHNYKERFYSHPLILILLLTITEVGLQVIGYFVLLLPSQYYSALVKSPNERDFPAFRRLIIRSFGYVVLNALLNSFSTLLSSILYIQWRTRLVMYLHSFYFTDQRYYYVLNTTQQNHQPTDHLLFSKDRGDNHRNSIVDIPPTSSKQSIDNPDQRITQDVDSLCRSLSSIIPLILISPFTIVYYTYRTWQVTGYYGPLAIFLYFILWTVINKLFISATSRTIFQQNIHEGNFRFLHAQIRTYHESIAFYHGGSLEQTRFDSYFIKLLSPILYRRTLREFFLSLSTNLYQYIGSILTYLILSLAIFILHFYDHLTITELVRMINETLAVIGYLIYRFSLLNDLADELTLIAANTHRIQSFVEYMKNIDTTWSEEQLKKTTPENGILIIRNLSYSSPDDRKHVLMRNLNLVLNKGQRLLITGDSGVGKTSLFRVLHSMWPANINGSFSYDSHHTYLLPQRPYFTNRSLSDELTYPHIHQYLPSITQQKQIEEVLHQWNLSHILRYVDSSVYRCPEKPWQDVLSPGEVQRLSFVRLVLRLSSNENGKVKMIFLDEITSSIDEKMEMKMYEYLIEQNVTMLSISHRESLRQYHQIELQVEENGNYKIENISM